MPEGEPKPLRTIIFHTKIEESFPPLKPATLDLEAKLHRMEVSSGGIHGALRVESRNGIYYVLGGFKNMNLALQVVGESLYVVDFDKSDTDLRKRLVNGYH